MKIVIISPFQKNLLRGIETFVNEISNQFEKNGHDIIVYSWSGPIKNNHLRFRTVPKFKYFIRRLSSFFYNFWLKIDKPDIVILNFWYNGEQWINYKKTCNLILHVPYSIIPNRYIILNQLNIKINLIAVSEFVKKQALIFNPSLKINVINLGINHSRFRHKIQRNIKDISTVDFLMVAALEKRKNIDIFIHFILKQKNMNWRLTVYGEGPYKAELNNIISMYKLEDKVILKNPIKNIEIAYFNADVFVCLAEGEAFGLSWLEAAATGIPILAADISPYRELMSDEFASFVNIRDFNSIVNGIDEIIRNYSSMSKNSFLASLEYTWENSISKLTNYLE